MIRKNCPILINLTPHALIIFNENEEKIKEIPSSGIVRVKEKKTKIGEIKIISDNPNIAQYDDVNDIRYYEIGVPIYKIDYTESEGLPAPEANTYYFVSIIVAQANLDRKDLLLSSDLVRDESGKILGCKSFATLNAPEKESEIFVSDEYKDGLCANRGRDYVEVLEGEFKKNSFYIKRGKWSHDIVKFIYKKPITLITYHHSTHSGAGSYDLVKCAKGEDNVILSFYTSDDFYPKIPDKLSHLATKIKEFIQSNSPNTLERWESISQL